MLARPVRDHNFGDSPDQCQLHAAPSGDKRSCESMRVPTQIADYASMGAYLIANRGVDSSGRWIGGRQLAQGNARTRHSAPLDCNDVVRSHKRQKLAKAEHSGPHTTEGASMRTVAPASIVSSDSDCAGHVSTTSQSETLSALSKLLSAARQCTSTHGSAPSSAAASTAVDDAAERSDSGAELGAAYGLSAPPEQQTTWRPTLRGALEAACELAAFSDAVAAPATDAAALQAASHTDHHTVQHECEAQRGDLRSPGTHVAHARLAAAAADALVAELQEELAAAQAAARQAHEALRSCRGAPGVMHEAVVEGGGHWGGRGPPQHCAPPQERVSALQDTAEVAYGSVTGASSGDEPGRRGCSPEYAPPRSATRARSAPRGRAAARPTGTDALECLAAAAEAVAERDLSPEGLMQSPPPPKPRRRKRSAKSSAAAGQQRTAAESSSGTAFTKASQVCVECKARKPPDAFSVRAATGNLFAKCKQCSRQACRARWEALGPPTASNYGVRRAAAAAERADPGASPAAAVVRGAPTKHCSGCNQRKPCAEFYRNQHTSDGFRPECKACFKRVEGARQRRAEAKKAGREAW